LEQINPYAVIRNTATYEAYKAYNRKLAMTGMPFLPIGLFMGLLAPQLLLHGGRWLFYKSPLEVKWAFASLILSMAVSLALMGVGALRMIKFRRENPIPDEWRQVPRIRTPLVPARKPRLLARD